MRIGSDSLLDLQALLAKPLLRCHPSVVRFPIFLLVLVLACSAAHAQVQEKKLSQRLNLTQEEMLKMSYDVRNSSFGQRGVNTKAANTNEFLGTREFSSRSFLSKTFGGSKPSWL